MFKLKIHRCHALSRLIVATTCLLLSLAPAYAATYTVSSTNDSGAGSLRQAITDANASTGVADTIEFAIGSGIQTITLLSALPQVTDTVTIDGTTQPGFASKPIIVLKPGPGLPAPDGPDLHGLDLVGSGCTVKGLVINGFLRDFSTCSAIAISGSNNRVLGCYLGIAADGTTAAGNGHGVIIYSGGSNDVSGNIIGGSGAGERNVISGNNTGGITMMFVGNATVIKGNYIGTNATGTNAIGNGHGISVGMGSNSSIIGGAQAGEGNLISGNRVGIDNMGESGTLIQGNRIGTNATATAAIKNNTGIYIDGLVSSVRVGGTQAGARNVISGNGEGVNVGWAYNTQIQGNYIGTNAAGTAAIGNTIGITHFGRFGDSGTLIGGTQAGARNVISGNAQYGIRIDSSRAVTIQGNYIGTNATATATVGNQLDGIFVTEGRLEQIGGTAPGAGNVISGNARHGIHFDYVMLYHETGIEDSAIQGNYIVTNAAGTAAVGNGGNGIHFASVSYHTIGGTAAGARNIISGNAGNGIHLTRGFYDSTGNITVQGNYIGVNAEGTAALGNGGHGIFDELSQSTLIGGTTAGARNVISGNTGDGVHFATDQHTITGNYIGTNAGGTAAIGNGGSGVHSTGDYTNSQVGGTESAARNIISGNRMHGVHIESSGVVVEGNFIGTDAAGTAALGNAGDGIRSGSASGGAAIGNTTAGAGNRIAFNGSNGVSVLFPPATPRGPQVRGNAIFANTKLGIDINNDGVTANDGDATGDAAARLQDFPTITGIVFAGGNTTLTGTLKSRPNVTYALDFYRSPAPDASGYGEGETYVGSTSVMTGSTGNAAFSFTIPGSYSQQVFAATATAQGGMTSEFSSSLLMISGRVTTAEGTAVAGTTVTRSGGPATSTGETSTVTDADGNYTLSGVAPGTYSLSAVRAGFTFTPDFTNPTVIDTYRTDLDFTATPAPSGSYNISGRVSNHSGQGIPRVLMRLTGGRQVETDADGNYALTAVPTGTYMLAPVLTPALTGVVFHPGPLPLTVSNAHIYNQNLLASFMVSGRVTNHSGQGIPNVLVQRRMGTSIIGTYTDANGNYSFSGVRSGTYTIAPVLTPAQAGTSFTPTSRTATVDRANIFNQSFIAMFSVSGRITTSTGAGLANVLVRLSAGSSSTTVLTDSNGNYRFANARSGTYSITPTLSGHTFNPEARSGVTVSTVNVGNQNFTASG